MSYHLAVAVTQKRRAEWDRVFGTIKLPILDGRPRPAEMRDGTVLVYDVAVAALHPGQVARLAGHIARRRRMDYDEARSSVETDGFVIRAEGVVIETADAGEGIGRFVVVNMHRMPALQRRRTRVHLIAGGISRVTTYQ